MVEVLRGSRLSLGPKMEEFEHAMARYIGTDCAVAVSSGTAGLHLCIRALGVGEGDEVIVPSFTFVAAANAIRYERATPVFVDVDAVMLNLDPERIEAAITPRTRAILVVHTFGCPAEMEAILEIARRRKLLVIEDACEAIGAEYRGRKVGRFGDAAAFAFYPNKQITTGEGGMVVTRDEALAKRIRALRNQGRYDGSEWLQHRELGYNYRLSEMNCALGVAQLSRIDEILKARDAVARKYDDLLRETLELHVPVIDPSRRKVSWFVYVARLGTDYSLAERDAIAQQLTADGIACGKYFAPIHLQPSYSEWRHRAKLPVSVSAGERVLALPFFNRISDGEIEYVCERLKAAVSGVVGCRRKK